MAYALYKRHKRNWADKMRSEDPSAPSREQEEMFAASNATDDQLERYRKDAQDALLSFANAIVEQQRPGIEAEAISNELRMASDAIKDSGSFLALLKVGVASTIISTALLALLAFGTDRFGLDLLDALKTQGAASNSQTDAVGDLGR
ncbi:hypothetical protein ACTTAL_16095 [Rhodobacter capsulatus]|uniref:hypothetical protein n=1 Tax=Rhodobacter capsulatus TaxID=1061 RepID=UPI001040881F|nr:hypothetical protein [Rhodobacter capsulatus]